MFFFNHGLANSHLKFILEIYGKLVQSRDFEHSLSAELRSLRDRLSGQRELTDAFESAPPLQEGTDGEETQVSRLRTKLLRISNDLELSRERIVKLEFEEKNCREEIEELNAEQER